MSDKAFLDTNILVYAIELDGPDPEKSAIARRLTKLDRYSISTQVVGEFYNVVTNGRRKSPMNHSEATAWVQLWKRARVSSVTPAHIDLALEIADRFQLSYYDSLILAAARLDGCDLVYSEDLSDGQDYGGVRVVNPFT